MSHLLIVGAADEPGWFLYKPHGNGERISNYAPNGTMFNLPIAKFCCGMHNDLCNPHLRCHAGEGGESAPGVRCSGFTIGWWIEGRRSMRCVFVVHKSVCPLVSDQDSLVLIER